MNRVFDKTEKGREEIATRKYRLSPRLRTLLVLIDGKQQSSELLKTVGGLGLTAESFEELESQGFIQGLATIPATEAADTRLSRESALVGNPGNSTTPAAPSSEVAGITSAATSDMTDAERFQAVYQFYNETIRTTIGLRGYGLQLKVEKASTLDELRALRRPYLEAVLKAKGNDVARSLRNRLDHLLIGPERSDAMGNTIFAITDITS